MKCNISSSLDDESIANRIGLTDEEGQNEKMPKMWL